MPPKRKRAAPAKPAAKSPTPSAEPRSRTSSPPVLPAECPFKVEYRQPTRTKRSRTSSTPLGTADETVYTIQPKTLWESLKKYRNFVVGAETFAVDDYVFINHLPSIPPGAEINPGEDDRKFWIARVLEIRAVDEAHVYLRVYWMYWPEELPDGREWYHGRRELVASNHMEIVDAMTVSGRADVRRWEELDEEEEVEELFWRQKLDFLSSKLSPVRVHCKCQRYYNPDTVMYLCPHCKTWLHTDCIIADIRTRIAGVTPKVEEEEEEVVKEVKTPARGRRKSTGAVKTEQDALAKAKAELERIEVELLAPQGEVIAKVRDMRGVKPPAKKGRKGRKSTGGAAEEEGQKVEEKVIKVECLCCRGIVA